MALEFITYRFLATDNTELDSNVVGTVNASTSGNTVELTVPFDTDVTSLIADYTVSGDVSTVVIGTTTQTSGTTPNDFTSPVTYILEDSSFNSDNWIVSVTIAAASTESRLSAFNFLTQDTLEANAVGSISAGSSPYSVTFTNPNSNNVGNDITNLSATITYVDSTATIAPDPTTETDYTGIVQYITTAQDGSTTSVYNVDASGLIGTSKKITDFSAASTSGTTSITTFTTDYNNAFTNSRIDLYTNFSEIDVTEVIPTITLEDTDYSSVSPSSGSLVDFSTDPVEFTVTAQDGSTKIYDVYLHNIETDILDFTTSEPNAVVAIDNTTHTVTISVPSNADISSIPVTNVSVSTGATENIPSTLDFSGSTTLTYTITSDAHSVTGISTHIQDYDIIIDVRPALIGEVIITTADGMRIKKSLSFNVIP